MIGKRGKKGARGDPKKRVQFPTIKARLRATNQFNDRLLQVAVLGEEHTTPVPQA